MTDFTTSDPLPSQLAEAARSKEQTLLMLDQAMFATAHRYNLDDLASRTQSHRHLVRLFLELTRHAHVDVFVEAGAREAWASRQVKRSLPKSRVVAFEANPLVFGEFLSTNEPTGVEYLNLALNSSPGPVPINLFRDGQGRPLANGQASLLRRDKEPRDREQGFHQVTVEGVTLDGFLEAESYEQAAVWVDVEGACKFVLSGGPQLLAKTAVAMIEVEDAAYWGADHWLRAEVVSYLYDFGLIPIARDFENVNQWSSQYNIVFVRDELLQERSSFRNELARFRSQAYCPPPEPSEQTSPPEPSEQTSVAPPPAAGAAARARALARRALGRVQARGARVFSRNDASG